MLVRHVLATWVTGALSPVTVGLHLGPEYSGQKSPLLYPGGKWATELDYPEGESSGRLLGVGCVCLGTRGSIHKAPLQNRAL